LFDRFGVANIESWSPDTWESFALHLLWNVCHAGVHGVRRFAPTPARPIRHRDLLLEATGVDTDRLLNDVLIRFCSVYLDQGIAAWTLPNRDQGFFRCWFDLYRTSRPVEPWLRGLPAEIRRIEAAGMTPLEVIDESLQRLGLLDSERDEYLEQTLLALRGWAGMLWQMETNAEWTLHPAPAGSLVEYLTVRLLLERLALAHVAQETLGGDWPLGEMRSRLHRRIAHPPRVSVEQRTFQVFWAGPPNSCFSSRRANGRSSSRRLRRFPRSSVDVSITSPTSGAIAFRRSTRFWLTRPTGGRPRTSPPFK
jgi:uncharacterized protein